MNALKTVRLVVCLAMLLAGGARGQTEFTTESFDLNDNQVPAGWQLIQHGGAGGLENGRLNAYPVDAYWELQRTGTVPEVTPGYEVGFQLQWDGNVDYSNPGMSTGFRLQMGDCELHGWVGIDIWRPGQQPEVRIVDPCCCPAESPLYAQAFPYDYTTYRNTVTIWRSQLRTRVVRCADETVMCDTLVADANIDPALLEWLGLRAYTTLTAAAWLDNISVTVLTREIDEPEGTPACDEFDGSSINTSLWSPASGTWSQSGGWLSGYWNLSAAHADQANLLWIESNGQTEYTFEADLVMQTNGYGHRIVLYNSAGNKYNIAYHGQAQSVMTEVKRNGGMYSGLPQYAASDLTYFGGTPGAVHRAKVVRSGTQFTFYLNDHELFTLDETIFGGDVTVGLGAYGSVWYDRACFTPGGEAPGPTPTILTLSGPSSCRTGETIPFLARLTDANGTPLANRTIDFTWTYTGLEPAADFAGSFVGTTDLLGECTLSWFSKWAAFYNEVDATIAAEFAGDGHSSSSHCSEHVSVESESADVHIRVYKDIDGNGSYLQGFDPLMPGVEVDISSAYNDFTHTVTSGTGEYDVVLPKCAYSLKAQVNGVELTESILIGDYAPTDNTAHVCLAYAPPAITMVDGTTYRDGSPTNRIAGADVSLYYMGGGGLVAMTTTDESGYFEFPNVRCEQSYLLYVSFWAQGHLITKAEVITIDREVQVSFVVDVLVQPLIDVDHCLSALGDNSAESNCLLGILKRSLLLAAGSQGAPGLCMVGTANALCEFYEAFTQARDYSTPERRQRAASEGVRFLSSFYACTASCLAAIGGELGIAASDLAGLRYLADLFGWINMGDEILRCIMAHLEGIGISLADEQGAVGSAIADYSYETGTSAYFIATHSPVHLCLVDEVGDSLYLDDDGNVTNQLGPTAGITRDGAGHEIAFLSAPQGVYDVEIRPVGSVVADTSFGLGVIYPQQGGQYFLYEFAHIHIAPGQVIGMLLPSASDSLCLRVDSDNDGVADRLLSPTSVQPVTSGQGLASLSGNALLGTASQPLASIPLHILNADGNLWRTVITDDTGYYHIDSIPNGDYTVEVQVPLGFVPVTPQSVAVTVSHVPVTVDFELAKAEPGQLANVWWWKTYLDDLRTDGARPDQFTEADINAWAQAIFEHYYGRLDEHAIGVEGVTYLEEPVRTLVFEDICFTMLDDDHSTYEAKVRYNLLANMLNVASNRMSQAAVVTEDGMTASQAIRFFADSYLENAGWTPPEYDKRNKLIQAYFCLRDMTMGKTLAAGIVPVTTPNVMYRPDDATPELLPTEFALQQNHPNPFNPVTEIGFSLASASEVRLEVYNIAGQKVITLIDGQQYPAGSHSVMWDASSVATGVYLYRLEAGSFVETRKMLLLK